MLFNKPRTALFLVLDLFQCTKKFRNVVLLSPTGRGVNGWIQAALLMT